VKNLADVPLGVRPDKLVTPRLLDDSPLMKLIAHKQTETMIADYGSG
jgi:hypothetical protein